MILFYLIVTFSFSYDPNIGLVDRGDRTPECNFNTASAYNVADLLAQITTDELSNIGVINTGKPRGEKGVQN